MIKLLSNRDRDIHVEKIEKNRGYGAQISEMKAICKPHFSHYFLKEFEMNHMMTSDSTYCLIISAYIFSDRTLHYVHVCNIVTDNFSLE